MPNSNIKNARAEVVTARRMVSMLRYILKRGVRDPEGGLTLNKHQLKSLEGILAEHERTAAYLDAPATILTSVTIEGKPTLNAYMAVSPGLARDYMQGLAKLTGDTMLDLGTVDITPPLTALNGQNGTANSNGGHPAALVPLAAESEAAATAATGRDR